MDPETPAREDGPTPNHPPAPATPPTEEDKAASDRKKARKEQLTAELRASMQRKRPWTAGSCLLLLLLAAVPAGLLAWWLWPRGEPPTLVVTAFDQVGVSGTKAVCRAQLQPLEPGHADFDLSGCEVVFQEVRFDLKEKSNLTKARTQANGVAGAEWAVPAGLTRLPFTVRYVTPDRLSQTNDQARRFGWPQGTKIVLVDVAALVQGGASVWDRDADPDLTLLPGAAEALRSAQAKKFAVAYLATGAGRAVTYRQVRNWLERSAAGPGGIPDGPVLGRLSVSATASAADLPKAVVADLRRFDGPLIVLTGPGQTAEAYRAAEARVLVVGQGEGGWGEVAKKLEK
jgi:hypothetical protein